jgi:MoaA/NifB/PqqE/SkfB family radical SAM enzyme
MKKIIKIVNHQKDNILEIRWMVNNVCNYKCRYCFPGSNEGTLPTPDDIELIIANFDHMLTYYKEKLGKTKFHLKVGGGEPTLWRHLHYFIESLKKKHDIYFTVISNGSRTLRWWKEYGHLIDNATLSYHTAEANADHMIAVADTLHELGTKTSVKVLMDSKLWEESQQALEYMKANSKHKWFLTATECIEPSGGDVIRIVDSKKQDYYTPTQRNYVQKGLKRIPSLSWMFKNLKLFFTGEMRLHDSSAYFEDGTRVRARPETYISNKWNNFEGYSCNMGLESIYIHHNGDIISSCWVHLYGLDYIHNVFNKTFVQDFHPELQPITCNKTICFCETETHVSKQLLG